MPLFGRFVIVAALGALTAIGWFTLSGRPEPDPAQSAASAPAPAHRKAPVARGPLDLIPADTLLCWKGEPPADAQVEEQPNVWDTVIDLIPKLFPQVLDARQKLTLRLFGAFGVVVRYPFAIGLLDARAMPKRPDSPSAKLESLKIVLVIDCRGDVRPFIKIIQRTLDELSDAGTASIARMSAGDLRYAEFRDARAPDWCRVAWGRIGEQFVVTLGKDVWPRVAAVARGEGTAISRDPWSAPFRSRRANPPLIEVILDARQLRDRLDPVVSNRATGFFQAWEAGDLDRAHWVLGFEGRALFCEAYFKYPDKSRHRVFADPTIRDEKYLQTVPGETRYAIYRLPLRRFLPRLIAGIVATRDQRDRQSAIDWWDAVQQKHQFDAERDVLANMGDTIVLHNDPPHPLRIPLAVTVLYEIRRKPQTVIKTLETMCSAWQEGLETAAERDGVGNPMRVVREDDGVWYLEFPLFRSLAWTFTDRYIITCWSPDALREYLDKIGEKIGKR